MYDRNPLLASFSTLWKLFLWFKLRKPGHWRRRVFPGVEMQAAIGTNPGANNHAACNLAFAVAACVNAPAQFTLPRFFKRAPACSVFGHDYFAFRLFYKQV
jgi:hypothetical protein